MSPDKLRDQAASVAERHVLIASPVPKSSYGSKSGPSMATPHVAGAWAKLRQRYKSAGVGMIKAAMDEPPRLNRCTDQHGAFQVRVTEPCALQGQVCALRDVLAFVVHDAEVEVDLRAAMALLGGQPPPPHRLGSVPRNTLAIGVHEAVLSRKRGTTTVALREHRDQAAAVAERHVLVASLRNWRSAAREIR